MSKIENVHKKKGVKSLDAKGVVEQVRGRVKGEHGVAKLGSADRDSESDKDRIEERKRGEGLVFGTRASQLRSVAIRYRPVRKRYKYWAPGSRHPWHTPPTTHAHLNLPLATSSFTNTSTPATSLLTPS